MPEKPLFCLGEAWVELGADTVPELAETFRVSVSGWGAAFCRAYVRAGGHAALLSQLGADPFGRKVAAQLAADGIDCTHLCFTDAARTPVVFSGAGKLLPYRAPSAELLYAPEQLDAAALRGAFALCFSSGCLLDSPARGGNGQPQPDAQHPAAPQGHCRRAGRRSLRLLCAPDGGSRSLLAGRRRPARNGPAIFSTSRRAVVERFRPRSSIRLP